MVCGCNSPSATSSIGLNDESLAFRKGAKIETVTEAALAILNGNHLIKEVCAQDVLVEPTRSMWWSFTSISAPVMSGRLFHAIEVVSA